MARRRRRKRYHPVFVIVPALLVIGLITGLIALIVMAIGSGYDAYVKSTYRLAYYDQVSAACEDYAVDEALVYAIMRTESQFDPQAVSSADARGLMQITAVTLDWAQIRSDEFDAVSTDDLFDPSINIRVGVYVLSLLEEQFVHEDTVVAAYNAGLGVVDEWLDDPAYSSDGVTLHTIPYDETAAYVKRVKSAKGIYKEYYQLRSPVSEQELAEAMYVEPKYTAEITAACEEFGIDKALVYAIICTESKFDPNAVSSVDARGLMQITDVALDWAQIRSNEFDELTMDDMFDPALNIRCGVYLLSLLKEQFADDYTVAAAHNAGVGIVNEWLGDSTYSHDGETLYYIPYPETAHYVVRVRLLRALYAQMI